MPLGPQEMCFLFLHIRNGGRASWQGVLKPKIDLLSSLDLDIPPQWRFPRPLSGWRFQATRRNNCCLTRTIIVAWKLPVNTCMARPASLQLIRRSWNGAIRINDQAQDLLRERDALEIGMSISGNLKYYVAMLNFIYVQAFRFSLCQGSLWYTPIPWMMCQTRLILP